MHSAAAVSSTAQGHTKCYQYQTSARALPHGDSSPTGDAVPAIFSLYR